MTLLQRCCSWFLCFRRRPHTWCFNLCCLRNVNFFWVIELSKCWYRHTPSDALVVLPLLSKQFTLPLRVAIVSELWYCRTLCLCFSKQWKGQNQTCNTIVIQRVIYILIFSRGIDILLVCCNSASYLRGFDQQLKMHPQGFSVQISRLAVKTWHNIMKWTPSKSLFTPLI